jgi:hypothetical protein
MIDDKKSNKVVLDYSAAIEHLNKFFTIDSSEKNLLVMHLDMAIKNATYRMFTYRSKYGVDMEKMELLRDVVFLGTSLIEQSSNNTKYYKGLVKACMSLVEIGTNKKFAKGFTNKMFRAMSAFQCSQGQYFQTVAFYFVFKAHFRLND